MDEQKPPRTFSQRYGYENLPEAMKLESLSQRIRVELYNEFLRFFDEIKTHDEWGDRQGYFFKEDDEKRIQEIFAEFLRCPIDEVRTGYYDVKNKTKEIIVTDQTKRSVVHKTEWKFNKVLDFIEIFISHYPSLYLCFTPLFERHQAAYRLQEISGSYQFIPVSSPEEAKAVTQALDELESSDRQGASKHLRDAAKAINWGDYAASVRESIHAVESIARQIVPGATTLGPALNQLEQAGVHLHPALKEGLKKLYGYTSDEKGIRHALGDEPAKITADDALFMFGACAAFAAYLNRLHNR